MVTPDHSQDLNFLDGRVWTIFRVAFLWVEN